MSYIEVTEKDDQVHITLNRPDALNALNHDMVCRIQEILNDYRDKDNIAEIVFSGAGDRAFCAGGDVKAIYYVGKSDFKTACSYFYDEYQMNKAIFHYPKPITSHCHGFVMGGGYGIAGNSRHIVIDNTIKFAMPETMIGFFPDVGIAYHLARAGALGMYIALTGDVFYADMMMAAGLATKCLSNFEEPAYLDEIKNHFSKLSVQEIFQSLEEDNSDFAQETLKTLKSRSPVSLLVTFQHLQMARDDDFDTVIARDYRLACAFFSKHDVYEGIRAQLIDKDRNPRWEHASIDEISQGDIDYYFEFIDNG